MRCRSVVVVVEQAVVFAAVAVGIGARMWDRWIVSMWKRRRRSMRVGFARGR